MGNRDKKRSDSLIALTSSALALPGLSTLSTLTPMLTQEAEAATLPDRSVAFQISQYQEADLDESNLNLLLGGETERYSIPVLMVNATLPLTEQLALSTDFSYETMSGASPWYLTPQVNPDNTLAVDEEGNIEPSVRMSGATIEDTRTDLGVTVHYFLPRTRIDATGRISNEDDYSALSAGLGVAVESESKRTTVEGSISVSADTIEATEPELFPGRPEGERRKGSFSGYGGATWVLNKVSTFQFGVGFKMHTGYLTDPYKEVTFFNGTFPTREHEFRPSDREIITVVARYRLHFIDLKGTLHSDFRLYSDNWGVDSHTIDLAFYKDIGSRFQVVPSLRFYAQSEADFYQPIFVGEQADYNYYSSDYRLSSYGAVSARVKFIVNLDTTSLNLNLEHYNSDGSLGLGDSAENPALVNFNVISLGASTKF